MKTRTFFPVRLTALGLTGEGVEVGVLFGEHAAHILNYWPGKLHLVDPWTNQDPAVYLDGCNAIRMERAYKKTLEAIDPHKERVEIHRKLSLEAVKDFKDESLDWVYIDANHAEASMDEDLPAWWKKIKPGGVLAGHDYMNINDEYRECGVKAAVDRFVSKNALRLYVTSQEEVPSWFIEKPGAPADRQPIEGSVGPLMAVLGVSHVDIVQAEGWLKWASDIEAKQKEEFFSRLVVVTTQRVTEGQRQLLVRACGMCVPKAWYTLYDECEVGYPKSASHLFLRAMEWTQAQYANSPILWMEPDTVPMRPGWFTAIENEYRDCGYPFMGVIEREFGAPHMAGCGVYPHRWHEHAPKLKHVLAAPDIPTWGAAKGQAFDTYACDQIVPQCAESRMIQQIWRPPLPIRHDWAKAYIRPDTALFHQCKDGSLIAVLRGFPTGYAPPGASSPDQLLVGPKGISITSKRVGGWGS